MGGYFCEFEDEGGLAELGREGVGHFVVGVAFVHVESFLEGEPAWRWGYLISDSLASSLVW